MRRILRFSQTFFGNAKWAAPTALALMGMGIGKAVYSSSTEQSATNYSP